MWGKLQECVHHSQIHDVAWLKACLIEEWGHFNQMIIDEADKQWQSRLRACI